MRLMFVTLALALLCLTVLPAHAPALQVSSGAVADVTGPERLQVSDTGSYNVKIYGPDSVQWGFWVNVSGGDAKDSTLVSPDGQTATGKNYIMHELSLLSYPEFNFTLSAPKKPGMLTLTITALAEGTSAAGQTAISRWSVDIRAARDIALNTTVTNSGAVTVQDLKVAFMYKDHGTWVYISNQSVASVDPGKTQNVSTVWNTSILDNGQYDVRIVVDPDHEKAQYAGAANVVDRQIVLQTPGSSVAPPVNVRLVGFLVVIAVIAVVLVFWYRKKKIV